MGGEHGKLLRLFGRLDEDRQETLLAFAEFLAAQPAESGAAAVVQRVPRPAEETVAMAIRRLRQTYPMLDRRRLMGDAARHLAQNALDGRDARVVIDELEIVFERHYRKSLRSGDGR